MKRIPQTSRSSSSYARKRAVTACQVCRARRTKCDQKKPRCSFCEETGAECVSDPAGLSSFDPASIAILERLDGLDRKIEALKEAGGPAREGIEGPGTAGNQSPGISHGTVRPAQQVQAQVQVQVPLVESSSLLPGRLETVLAWPIFQESTSISPLPTSRELLTPGTRPPFTPRIILGDELNASTTQEHLQSFLDNVLIKNPVLEETYIRRLVRRISLEGPGWDAESCLALLVCANGAITRPFGSPSLSGDEIQVSSGRALFTAAQKRIGIILDSAGLLEAQCLFFAGVYLMTSLRPYDAWRSFLQGLAICQNFEFIRQSTDQPAGAAAAGGGSAPGGGAVGTTAEESIYWSCWKSERELRLELGLPDFSSTGSSSASTAPQRFPSLPPYTGGGDADRDADADDRTLRAWYFYLSEISLWRLEMEARMEITACIGKVQRAHGPADKLLDLLCEVSEIYSQQAVAWQDSLPSMVSISETSGSTSYSGSESGTDALRFILKGRKTYVNELITWPFIVHALSQQSHPDANLNISLDFNLSLTPTHRSWLAKGVSAHLERLRINAPGFYHRHHGTWLMIRSSARSACILLAIARVSAGAAVEILPAGSMDAVRGTIDMLRFWSAEVVGLEGVANFCQELLCRVSQ
ncbi:hypothetical protein BJY00DRAFT_319324 [Aspergillus carlsbadensis]|nr:hypothetical protein BJY00DRAFT_319324 [Aspergillus carlsbadensis]